jgi:RNA polymerase sigma-70 factor (ECF subfamily)
MFRILRNAWIDSLRQQKQEAPATDPADLEEILGEDGERAAVSRLMLQAVMGAIGGLPAEQREVLMLVCVEDFSYGEAAEMLGVPIGTVMSRLARAREKISRATGINPKSNR